MTVEEFEHLEQVIQPLLTEDLRFHSLYRLIDCVMAGLGPAGTRELLNEFADSCAKVLEINGAIEIDMVQSAARAKKAR
jgi:hypothetical protein